MATTPAAVSIALQSKAFLRSEDRIAADDRQVEGHRFTLPLRRSCSSAGMKRSPAGAVLASSPATHAAGSVVARTLELSDLFSRRIAFGALRPSRETRHQGENVGSGRVDPVSPEKLDDWMRESVSEIVRNIGEAPFLVHVFSSNEGPAGLRLKREVADAESWPQIRGRWSTGAALPPDGVILVEELREEEEEDKKRGKLGRARDHEDASWSGNGASSSSSSSSSKTWGVLVQGRGTDVAACYILHTCRVRSSFGFCTHFCLARAKCFGETADVQLRRVWLHGRKYQQH